MSAKHTQCVDTLPVCVTELACITHVESVVGPGKSKADQDASLAILDERGSGGATIRTKLALKRTDGLLDASPKNPGISPNENAQSEPTIQRRTSATGNSVRSGFKREPSPDPNCSEFGLGTMANVDIVESLGSSRDSTHLITAASTMLSREQREGSMKQSILSSVVVNAIQGKVPASLANGARKNVWHPMGGPRLAPRAQRRTEAEKIRRAKEKRERKAAK